MTAPPVKDATRTNTFVAVLMMLALLCSRPGLLGELVAPVGAGIAGLAALIAIASDRAIRGTPRAGRVLVLIFAAQVWVYFRRGDTGLPVDLQGGLLLAFVVICATIVFSNRARAIRFGQLFVGVIIVLSASSIVSFLLWLAGTPVTIFQFFTGQWTASILFPFTPSVGTVNLSGTLVPRLTGIGREPGWMGMFIGFAIVSWRYVGRPRWWGYLILCGGLLSTLSTAGFGIVVVVVAYEVFFRARENQTLGQRFGRGVAGLAMVALATWVAFEAPILGFNAKSGVNEISLDERSAVLQLGLDALAAFSLGEPTGHYNDGIGLIATAAPNGWPYFALMVAALLVALIGNRAVARGPVLIIFLTLLLAQPPQDSIGAYVLLIAVLGWVERPQPTPQARQAPRTPARIYSQADLNDTLSYSAATSAT